MDLSRYNAATRQHIENCQRMFALNDADARRSLRELRKTAKELNDNALLGFVYFYEANQQYDQAQYDRFHRSLRQAIYYLLRSNENELLARAYNLFAIDAESNEAPDVAYSYYINALRFLKEDLHPTVTGIILSNLANLYHSAGDFSLARKTFRKGIRLIRKNKNDPFYRRNLLTHYMNDGINSIAMNDLPSAETAYRRAKKIYDSMEGLEFTDVVPAFLTFEVQLAIAQGNTEERDALLEQIVTRMQKESAPQFYMEDIQDLCTALLANGQQKAVRQILDTIHDPITKCGMIRPISMLTQTEVDYYDAVGDTKQLTGSLLQQHHLLLQQKEERRKIFMRAIELVRLIGELQEEGIDVRRENRDLAVEAHTDALTRIPNRYALDEALEVALRRAQETKQHLSVTILDVDGFKSYNDKHGHRAGDHCLTKIGSILREQCSGEKLFCGRFGGDEFIVLCEGHSDAEVRALAEQTQEAIRACSMREGAGTDDSTVTVSQGICNAVPRANTRPEEYLAAADAALYESKGRNGAKKTAGRIVLRKLPKAKKGATR